MFPDMERLLHGAPKPMRAWLASVPIAIDQSERSHAAMRRDILSHGPASDFLAASERHLVRQAVAAHMDLGGKDPATTCIPLGDTEKVVNPRAGIGGNPRNEFHNLRMAAIKDLRAPGRPLSRPEIEAAEAAIAEEWSVIKEDPAKLAPWEAKFRAKRSGPSAPLLDREGAGTSLLAKKAPRAEPFSGLWGASTSPDQLVPAAALGEVSKGFTQADSRKKANDDINVQAPVPSRKSEIKHGWGSVFGCTASKRNICTHCMAGEEKKAFDLLTTRLIRWADTLSAEMKEPGYQHLPVE